MLKKLLIGVSTLAAAVATIPMFAAFEAHVVNVTARIENALFVHPESLEFGTVFPQERLDSSIFISFSESFSTANQRRVGAVDYVIKQKPKPRPAYEQAVGVGPAREWCHENFAAVQPGLALDQQPAEVQEYLRNCYPSLCPYLSKTPDNNPAPGNDVGVAAFHDPNDPANYFYGKLLKFNASGTTIGNDPADSVTIDLAVPCFAGMCAQDWAAFVRRLNPNADPNAYKLPPQLEHEVFGCDLWVEVTKIYSLEPGPELR